MVGRSRCRSGVVTGARAISRETRESQSLASGPNVNAWVSANAGSGKTHVLTQRVIRLLLEGVPPSRILCLTFTKAAAANMSLRVFDTLARWTSLDDIALEKAIETTGTVFHADLLPTARKLFSRTIETPGGLKIKTIHGFCESVLHLFPFEANVASGFQVIDEDRRSEFLLRAKTDAFKAAFTSSVTRTALEFLGNRLSAEDFDGLISEALSRRAVIAEMARGVTRWPDDYAVTFAPHLGLEPGECRASLEELVCNGGIQPNDLREMAIVLDGGGKNDQKLAMAMRKAALPGLDERCQRYLGLFFKSSCERRGVGNSKLVTHAVQKLDPSLLRRLDAEGDRLEPFVDKLKAADTVERGQALMFLVDDILKGYASLKRQGSFLDFDDLIERTLTLLSRSDSQWVMYKLDSGIDHILVDEAQDTSRQQWKILEFLAGEFSAGEGRPAAQRTFFAVGDEKQSIFSFQGAEPRLFDHARRGLRKRSADARKPFIDVALNFSFRSAPGILEAVDKVFSHEDNRRGLSSEDIKVVHAAWKVDVPSLIEIWSPVGAAEHDHEPDWLLPLDAVDQGDPAVVLADRIADLVSGLLGPGSSELVYDEKLRARRQIGAGDIMILMRRRGVLFEALIRALKHKGLPVAGADRMVLKDHIAVMDLIAVGRVCLLPEDDLALACVLKSPLIGFDDNDLLAIAPGRKGTFFDALAASSNDNHRAAAEKVDLWRRQSRVLTPFAFYSELLEARGGRAEFLSRLGPEAGDAMDEFLRLALTRESVEAPSLIGFLQHVENGDAEVKRDMEAAGQSIRVMTVHAAKGLEAKIVILPDTCQKPSDRFDPKMFELDAPGRGSFLAWSPKKDLDCLAVAKVRDQGRRERMDEYRRLLYVAMTRAEERLYIMGCYGAHEPPTDCWHQMIWRSLEESLTPVPAFWNGDETVWRLRSGDERPERQSARPVESDERDPLVIPAWLNEPVIGGFIEPTRVRPSKALSSEARDKIASPGIEFGRAFHVLLQELPKISSKHHEQSANSILNTRFSAIAGSTRAAVVRQALAVLNIASLGPLFGPGSIAEAPIAGVVELPAGRFVDVSGRIDRLVELREEVWFADFKTGKPKSFDDDAKGYLEQLALYAAALKEVFPLKPIRALLVWASGPSVDEFTQVELADYLKAHPYTE